MSGGRDGRYILAIATTGTIIAIALHTVGYLLDFLWAHLVALAVTLLTLVVVGRIFRRGVTPFMKRWHVLSESARVRIDDQYRKVAGRRNGAIFFMALLVVVFLGGTALALRADVIRGADLESPGVLFRTYNRLAAPELADLIDLFVVRDLPIENADTGDLRVLRNLYFATEGYRFTDPDLQEIFDPLIWYRPYRAFPNDINALPPESRSRVEEIMRVEASRR